MRHEFDYNLYKKGDQNAYKTQQGINKTRLILFDLIPGLDIIIIRPPDLAYLEFKGIAVYIYEMLIDIFFILIFRLEYCSTLQHQRFPPGQGSIPSPKYYLKSYNLLAYSKWSIIAPLLLEVQLEKDYINLYIFKAQRDYLFKNEPNPSDNYCVKAIYIALVTIARSNSVLIYTRNTIEQYNELENLVLLGR